MRRPWAIAATLAMGVLALPAAWYSASSLALGPQDASVDDSSRGGALDPQGQNSSLLKYASVDDGSRRGSLDSSAQELQPTHVDDGGGAEPAPASTDERGVTGRDDAGGKRATPSCGSHGFCVGFEPDGRVYCYGKEGGCKWDEAPDCFADEDCSKYGAGSPKFTDGDTPTCPADGWRADACRGASLLQAPPSAAGLPTVQQLPQVDVDWASLPSCALPPCRLHPPSAPRLFVAEHGDGAGHRMKNILEGMAVAVRNGMNFGGIVEHPDSPITEQGLNFREVLDAFFGSEGSRNLVHPGARLRFGHEFERIQDLEAQRRGFVDFESVWLGCASEWFHNESEPSSEYFTPRLRSLLRQPLKASVPLKFAPGRVPVAIHLRRGDLKPGEPRVTPDSFYFSLAGRIRRLVPDADIHVFSSTDPCWGSMRCWNSSSFDEYRQQGMTVHLDGDDPKNPLARGTLADPWAHFASARILVLAQSSFSWIGAILNPYCVLWLVLDRPLDGWMYALDEGRSSYDSELKACVDRAMAQP